MAAKNKTSDTDEPETVDAVPVSVQQMDMMLTGLFQTYATMDELDCAQFKNMLKDLNLLTKRFTAFEAELLFKKVIAKGLSLEEGNPLFEGIIGEKRINYLVFRSIAIGLIARQRSSTVDELLSVLYLKAGESAKP